VPRFLPLHEHSGAALHRPSWRHWCAAALGPMDFAGWFEAFQGGPWYTFDPRNNTSRIGRVLIAQVRDAADVPITQTLGPNTLVSFKVWTDELSYSCQPLSGRKIISSGFDALQSGGLREPQPKNLLGLIDAAQLKVSERLQASVAASRSLSKPR
jgi:hypothetical protein